MAEHLDDIAFISDSFVLVQSNDKSEERSGWKI
jgi:hypothetical protein